MLLMENWLSGSPGGLRIPGENSRMLAPGSARGFFVSGNDVREVKNQKLCGYHYRRIETREQRGSQGGIGVER